MARKGGINNIVNNGGILGSGVFGHFGSIVKCDAQDESMFCTLSKMVSIIMMLMFLAFVVYLIYWFYTSFMSTSAVRRKS
jgi:hypothetical protein